MLIAYGAAGITPGHDISSLRHVRIDPSRREPLRLNSGVLERNAAETDSPGGDMFSAIGEHLMSLCDPWSRSAREFLSGYLGFVRNRVEEDRREIEDRLRPYSGIYEVEDYRFSAWLPLQQAHIAVPQEGKPQALVACDFAFWSGRNLVAINVGTISLGAARVRDLDMLRSMGATVVEAMPHVWADPAERRRVLPPAGESFWRDQVLPCGPSAGASGLKLRSA